MELNSFVSKFWNLWSSGRTARLAVECQAGQATVNLQLDLGLPQHHPLQEHHVKHVSPSRLRRRARRAQARADAAVNAAPDAAAVDVAVQTNPNTAAEHAAPQEEAGQAPLAKTMEAAVQAAPKTTVAAVQAVGHGMSPPNVDVAVQADDLQHPRHPPQQAAQALLSGQIQLSPAVQDMFCPDRDFLMAGRTEHEHDRRGDRVHQQRQREEERKQDLENFQKMLDKSLNFNLKF